LEWKGYRYSFLFLMAVELAAGVLGFVFFKDPVVDQVGEHTPTSSHIEKDDQLPSI